MGLPIDDMSIAVFIWMFVPTKSEILPDSDRHQLMNANQHISTILGLLQF